MFFVISGFLMGGVILQGLEAGKFSLFAFYMARARRIIPALAALCVVLIVVGWFVLVSPDYKTLATHSAYSISFLSNFEYWLEAGYFDQESHEKWLLHTWSLSVEWQFYMLLPLFMWGMWRHKPGIEAQRYLLGGGVMLSLLACVMITASDPSGAFFLLHTRAWEMLAGALLYVAVPLLALGPRERRWMELAGLFMIVVSVAVFDSSSAWPGWRAMVPVTGAVLVLAAHRSSAWTGNAFAQWAGDRSYSLYLWHWPVFVALTYFDLDGWVPSAAGISLSFLLGHLSYTWIEVPARSRLSQRPAASAAGIVAVAAAIVAVAAVAVWKMNGVAGRFDPAVEVAAKEIENFNPRRKECHMEGGSTSPSCVFGGPEWKVILLGDSHAGAIVSSLALAPGASGVVQWSYSGCVYVPGMRQLNPHQFGNASDCAGFNAWATARLAMIPTNIPVVIVGRYARSAFGPVERKQVAGGPEVYFGATRHVASTPEFLHEFGRHVTEAACAIAKTRTVYIVRPLPEMTVHVPRYVSRRLATGMPGDVSISMEEYRQRNGWVLKAQDVARDQCGVKILDPLPYLCRAGRCYATKGGRPIYYDHGHISEFGNKLLSPMFAPVFEPRR